MPAVTIAVENIVTSQTEERENIYETINVVKMSKNGDYNSTSVFCFCSNLGSNFFVQLHIEDEKEANKSRDILANTNIFMRITNAFLPNRPITSSGDDF
ncbi:MAG: hypothetical protein Ta2E_10600 [Mycoplasmoidaceae bacterium]|nr:MAG: hypothetical protein Ta2E_10600 [Mycoplasmoidaceae bacterium]